MLSYVIKFYSFKFTLHLMLNFNNSNGQNDDLKDNPDPNAPIIPEPGEPPYDVDINEIIGKPPEPHELQAVTGGTIRGVGGELTNEINKELARQGISKEAIIGFAAAYGISQAQAAGVALGRAVSGRINREFNRLFGGGGGGTPPPISFGGPNMSDGGSGPGGGGGGHSGGGGGYNHPWLHSHLDTNAKPNEATLDIGLKVPAYVPFFKEYEVNSTSPLHITCAIPQIPITDDYSLGRFNAKAIVLRFIERVARSVNYQLDSNTFSATNIAAYFNLILKGLAYYYWYESIYTYATSDVRTRNGDTISKTVTNDGLIGVRRLMTADMLNEIVILRSCLASLPIPPNMVSFVYWMYQNWQVHSLADSPVIRFCPFPIDPATNLPGQGQIASITTDLNTHTNRAITSTLVKAFDEWYKMDLPASCEVLAHSADFTTLFANAPGVYINTASSIAWRMPGVAAPSTRISYSTYSDELEGGIVAMCAVWDGSKNLWAPSLMAPVESVNGTITQNRFSWTGFASGFRFQTIYDKPFLTIQRPETAKFFPTFSTGGITLGPVPIIHDPFSERLYGINIEAISEVGMSMVMWLFNFENYSVLTGSAGGVSPTAPRGKALGGSGAKGNRWTKKTSRSGSSPEVDRAVRDFTGGSEL